MVTRIEDMPEGTIGLRASGSVSREDYRDVIEPLLRQAVDAGEVRLMLVAGPEFEKMDIGARIEDAKTNLRLGLGHRSAWKRTAIVSDVDWIGKAFALLGWLGQVEVKVWPVDKEQQARAWLVDA